MLLTAHFGYVSLGMEFHASPEQHFSLNIKGQLYHLDTPKIMGILNITPDSFSDGGKYNRTDAALHHVGQLYKAGADILDIGAQSTRPGATLLSAEEEIFRLGNIIQEIKVRFPKLLISLDTFYGEVVRFGVEQGIDIINDISAMRYDKEMKSAVIDSGLPYILMHGNAAYENMHEKFPEEDMLLKINYFFSQYCHELYEEGVRDIIIDPGFGFGKSIEQQFALVEEACFIGFGEHPVLAGISKKSFLYKSLDKDPNSAEVASAMEEVHLKLLQAGIKILRVHDVAAARRTIDSWKKTS